MRNLAKISLKQTATTSATSNTPNQTTSNTNNDDKKYIIPKSLTNTYIKLPTRI